eukprot:12082316-Alexandrium_andersonii.AAC.1
MRAGSWPTPRRRPKRAACPPCSSPADTHIQRHGVRAFGSWPCTSLSIACAGTGTARAPL